jgi:hypothetical protein
MGQIHKTDLKPPNNPGSIPDKMKTHFLNFLTSKHIPAIDEFIEQENIRFPKCRSQSRVSFNQFMNEVDKTYPAGQLPIRVYEPLMEQKALFEAPPPEKMTMERKHEIIIQEMQRFNQEPTTFEDEHYDLEIDGYTGYIRRTFVPKAGRPVSKIDVEYHIHLNNFRECKVKKEFKRWGAFIYINEPEYWNTGRYKSLPGTTYGVQHSIHF